MRSTIHAGEYTAAAAAAAVSVGRSKKQGFVPIYNTKFITLMLENI